MRRAGEEVRQTDRPYNQTQLGFFEASRVGIKHLDNDRYDRARKQ